jgi:hypothetical protein
MHRQRRVGPITTDQQVTCVHCARALPIGHADVVGTGYRCAACGTLAAREEANGGLDLDHWTPEERAARRRTVERRLRWSALAAVLIGGVPALLVTAIAGPAVGMFAGLYALHSSSAVARVADAVAERRQLRRSLPELPEARVHLALPAPDRDDPR